MRRQHQQISDRLLVCMPGLELGNCVYCTRHCVWGRWRGAPQGNNHGLPALADFRLAIPRRVGRVRGTPLQWARGGRTARSSSRLGPKWAGKPHATSARLAAKRGAQGVRPGVASSTCVGAVSPGTNIHAVSPSLRPVGEAWRTAWCRSGVGNAWRIRRKGQRQLPPRWLPQSPVPT